MKVVFGIMILLLIIGFTANAAVFSDDTLELEISPSSPRPGETFTVQAQSFRFDATLAQFRWFVNNSLVASGAGIVEQTFALGRAGTEFDIKVVAVTADGDVHETSMEVIANEIDLIVSSYTSVPATYQGSALSTPGSTVKIDAMPHLFFNGTRLNHKNLVYEWSLDREPITTQSGRGKSEFFIQLSPLSNAEHTVQLKVSSTDGAIWAEKSTRIKTVNPEVVLYQSSALTGIRPIALSGFFTKPGQSLSIVAEPYFFDLSVLPRIAGLWTIDGTPVPTEQGQNTRLLQLSIPEGTATYASILFSLQDTSNVFQRAQNSITVTTQ